MQSQGWTGIYGDQPLSPVEREQGSHGLNEELPISLPTPGAHLSAGAVPARSTAQHRVCRTEGTCAEVMSTKHHVRFQML